MPNLLKMTRNHSVEKDIYFEVDSENNVHRMAITDQGGRQHGDLKGFLDKCIHDAMKQDFIPDNLILHYENIHPDTLRASEDFFTIHKEQLIHFIVKNGLSDLNTIPLRKAVFLDFHGERITTESLKEVESRAAYKTCVAHENAVEKLLQDKPTKMAVTVAETNQGIVVFSDSLRGQKAQRDYLQHMADGFFFSINDGLEFLQLYRFETTSVPLIKQADNCCHMDDDGKPQYDFTPSTNAQIALLNGRNPMIGFDMRPNCPNLDTFLSHTGAGLSEYNNNTLILDSIARDGYIGSHGVHFSYEKKFQFMETALKELRRESRNNPQYPLKEQYELLQNNAKQLAHQILQNMHLRAEQTPKQMLRRLHTKPAVRESRTRKTVPQKTAKQNRHIKK